MGNLARLLFIFIVGLIAVNATAQTTALVDTTHVKEMLQRAIDLVDYGENETVIDIIDEAAFLSDSLNYEYGKSLSIFARIDLLITMGLADSALVVGENFLDNLPDSRLRMQYLNLQATAYRMTGNYDQSIEVYEEALKEADARNAEKNTRMKAGIKMNMAVVYGEIGNNNLMLESYLESLRFAEQADDSAFLAIVLNNLGNTFVSFGEPEKAVTYLERGLKIARDIESKVDELRTLTNYANALTDLGKLDNALEIYDQAFDLHQVIRKGVPPFILLHNMGQLNRQKGEYVEAEKYFKESLSYSEQYGVEEGVYYNASALGELYTEKRELQQARNWYNKSMESAQKLNVTPFLSDSYLNLYTINKELADYSLALQNFENYTQIADSLHDLEKEKELSELKSTLELDRQIRLNEALQEQQEIKDQKLRFQVAALITSLLALVLLLVLIYYAFRSKKAIKNKNIELESTTKQLEEILESRDHLMGVLAHDLRSPLATLQGLLDLISSDILTIEEIRELSKTIEPTLQKNSDTIKGLLAWSQSQRNGLNLTVSTINLNQLIRSVVDRQTYSLEQKKLTIELDMSEEAQALGDESAVRMVLRNLLMNAIKFTDEEGHICIRVKDAKNNNNLVVEVEDTGIGIPDHLKRNLFNETVKSRKGTNAEQGNGFGLSMCKAFIEKMDGYIYFESIQGAGSTFYVELPKP